MRANIIAEAAAYKVPVTYTPPPQPTTAAFVGDSYTVGSGASSTTKRWTTLLSREMDWLELNYGIGGTNYGAAGDLAGGKAYKDHLTDLIISKPDIVFVSSAGNGVGVDQTAAINETFQTLRAGLPDAKIYATSPYSRAGWYTKRSADFGEDVKAGVEAVGGEYLELDDPLGNFPDAVSDDKIHPDNTGYRIIADAVLDAIV